MIGAEAVSGIHRAVLLARDQNGYSNLCRLLSELHAGGNFDLSEALQRFRRGWPCSATTGCCWKTCPARAG
ncbi:MAG: hypothetical protein R2864_14460 [Syntrophotaleaceae bacterium]